MIVLYIILAIIMFMVLILVHEWGHFVAAKAVGVRVNEFAVGMGPLIWSKQGKETLYSLRAIPMGGYCAMEGEDEESNDPRAFGNQSAWKKIIILVAGVFMNFVLGVLLAILLMGLTTELSTPTVSSFLDGSVIGESQVLEAGDRIIKINGNRIIYSSDISLFMNRTYDASAEVNYVEMEVKHADGSRETLVVPYRFEETYNEDGKLVMRIGINLTVENKNLFTVVKQGVLLSVDFVRIVWMSLGDLVSGAVGISDMSGPIGIVETMASTANQSGSALDAAMNFIYYAALIAVNLAVMNLLPIPALDGGRVFFVIVGGIYTALTKRKMNEKLEGYVHGLGFILLIGLMIVVAFNDVFKLVTG